MVGIPLGLLAFALTTALFGPYREKLLTTKHVMKRQSKLHGPPPNRRGGNQTKAKQTGRGIRSVKLRQKETIMKRINFCFALAFAFALTVGPALAAEKPNIMFIMGDDIGWMQPSIYHRGLMVGETPNIDRIGTEGAIFMDYYAEQSCTAGRNAFFTGMHPLRTGMIPPQLPGSPSWLRPGTPALAKFLLDLGYTTGEFGKNHLGDHFEALPTSHGFQEFWGYLYHLDAMQGVSFPDINKTPLVQGIAPPCKNTPITGLPEVPGAVDPRTATCLTPPRPVIWCKSSDGTQNNTTCQDGGRRRSKGRRPWTRRSRPRSSTSSTATTRRRPTSRSSSGTTRRACTSRPCCRTSTLAMVGEPAARTGASTKPA